MAATTPKPDRVTIENVNHPGQTQTVDAAKYEAMRAAAARGLCRRGRPG